MAVGDLVREWGGNVNTKFHAASICGCLQHGANEDAVDAENRSPLHWAGVCHGPGGDRTQGGKGKKRSSLIGNISQA